MGADWENDYKPAADLIEAPVGHPGFDLNKAIDADANAVHNFAGDAETQFRLNHIAVGPPTASGREMIGEVIPVQYYYIHQVESVDNRGEVSRWPRVVLITPDLKSYAFGSWGVFDAVRIMIRHFGRAPWAPPRNVKVKQVTTRNGHSMLTLDPVAVG